MLWIVPQMQDPVHFPASTAYATPQEVVTPRELAYSLKVQELPVIGEGPLLRVVKIVSSGPTKQFVDPFTANILGMPTPEEQETLGAASYALERYGQTHGKRLALTFDDGPDPEFTPKILDVLSKEGVPSTFFAIGANVVQFPDVAGRIIREGHILGNHTFMHVDFDYVGDLRGVEEINATERVIRAVTGHYTAYFRLPYGGDADEVLKDNLLGLLTAQQLGYTVTSYNIDSQDWQFAQGYRPILPTLDGHDYVVLLHDAGGDRSKTIPYLTALISEAKAQGYEFATLDKLFAANPPLTGTVTPTVADRATLRVGQFFLVVPSKLMYLLFLLGASSVLVMAGVHILLAFLHRILRKRLRRRRYEPLVSVIVPAYNEEKVIAKTVRSLLVSKYRHLEIIVVDDGSTDRTAEIVRQLPRRRPVRLIRQENSGKWAALNRGFQEALGEIVVTLDADTLFTPQTVGRFVPHFASRKVGAVAGVVKVGNIGNILTRWQALEYITSIHVVRAAQSVMQAITIAPGSCTAWRKAAVLRAGGFSGATLAEDSDLALALHKRHYRLLQETDAVAFTEVPQTVRSFAKQRFRWTFGNMQALWKHRDMFFRRRFGLLGWMILPYTALSIVVPLLFFPLVFILMARSLANGDISAIGYYFGLFALVHLTISVFGVLVARERAAHLLIVPLYRLIYEPLWIYLLYTSLFTILRGSVVAWNRVPRSGSVNIEDKLVEPATV